LDQGDGALDPADNRAVLGRYVHNEICGDDGNRTVHFLGDDSGMPGNVLSKVMAHQPGIGVIPAARARPDNDLDPLAFEKFSTSSAAYASVEIPKLMTTVASAADVKFLKYDILRPPNLRAGIGSPFVDSLSTDYRNANNRRCKV
jgi:hypothetical protein